MPLARHACPPLVQTAWPAWIDLDVYGKEYRARLLEQPVRLTNLFGEINWSVCARHIARDYVRALYACPFQYYLVCLFASLEVVE